MYIHTYACMCSEIRSEIVWWEGKTLVQWGEMGEYRMVIWSKNIHLVKNALMKFIILCSEYTSVQM